MPAYPEFRRERCTRYRFRYSECRRCAEACPHDAISLDDTGASLDEARCQHCALCVTACLTDAWSSAAFAPIDLLRQAIKQPHYALACAPSGETADATVPCLGAIDGGFIAYLGKRGIPLILHGSTHCGACPHGETGAAQLSANLDAANHLRAACGATQWAELTLAAPSEPAADPRPPTRPTHPTLAARRQLFRRLFGRAADAVADGLDQNAFTPPPTTEDKAIRAGPYVSSERRELLQIVCTRKDGAPATMPWHEALPLLQLTLHAGCTTCEACFRACPTGALFIVENPGDWALSFDSDRCVACAVCLEVCQPRVLDAEASFDARPEQAPRELLRLVKQRCARCDRFFVSPSPQETCKVCSDDEEAFAMIFG